jgi:two-component system OmpR family sensor kinase/two-component system sensor histidine kinase BaeS
VVLASAFFGGLIAIAWHTGGGAGKVHHWGPGFAVALLALAALVAGLVFLTRVIRRTTQPVEDVMEAADRVAAGDYEVRLREQGFGDMRRLARSFNEMTERLGDNERRRRELAADLAHELRSPLSVIQGNAEGMLDGLYPMDAAHLEPVLDETKVMARLLEDLQTLSTAEAGALRLHREPVEPATLVDDAVVTFRTRAGEAGVRLEPDVVGDLPVLDADPVRVGEVLSNLVSNALRHTPSGGTVTVSAEAPPGSGGVAFAVTDTGPGIPADDLPHVFDRFVKGEGSRGAGLGLAIARSLVRAHGGELTAESEPGRGTTMRFVLPTAPTSPTPPASPARSDGTPG